MLKIKSLSILWLLGVQLTMSTAIQADTSLDEEYAKPFTDIIEFVYGDSMLSQGGTQAIDKLFEGVELNNKNMLDIGCGLGGVDVYLAQHFHVNITGIDRVQRLVTQAENQVKTHNLKGKLQFLHVEEENSLKSFQDNSFDIVFSKEVLLHIKDKSDILAEAYRVLKPGGKLVILDWLNPNPQLGPNIIAMMEADNLELHFDSESMYLTNLAKSGFRDTNFENLTANYIQYTQRNLDSLFNNQLDFISQFGEDNFNESVHSWKLQKKAFELDEIRVMRILAKKPTAS